MGKYDCSGPFVLILGLGENVIGPGKAFNAQKLCSFKRKSCILLKKKLMTKYLSFAKIWQKMLVTGPICLFRATCWP